MGIGPSLPPPSEAFTIGAEGAEVRRASDWLAEACRRRDVPAAPVDRLVICLNEVLANVIAHGGEAAHSAPIALRLDVGHDPRGGKASVTVSDAGTAFDPLAAPQRVLPRTLAQSSPGGLGLVMIRRCSDWLDYRREGGRNHLTFGARWSAE